MKSISIFYDNFCPMCTKFSKFVQQWDWLGKIQILQLRNPQHTEKYTGIDHPLAEKQMASYNGSWAYGFDTLFRIFMRLPLFWFAIPTLWLLKISGIGQFLYLQLAQRRKIIPLHCDNESCFY